MQNNIFKKIGISALAVFALTLAFFGGLFVDAQNNSPIERINGVTNQTLGQPKDADFQAFWTVWNILDSQYVPTTKENQATTTDSKKKIYGAIKGLVDSLNDPYTVFLTPEENNNLQTELSGSLEGVGMEVGIQNNILTVISPLKDSPAEKAGILPGDKIIKIDNTLTAGLSVSEAVRLIRGKKGTSVSITLSREGKNAPINVSVIRDIINIPVIDTQKVPDANAFMIRVYSFSDNAPALFRGALREFVYSGQNKLIIDLRNNPGGYLDAAVDMASWFLPAGKVVVTEDFGNNKDEQIYRSYGYDVFNSNLKVVILINNGSASASEILAGALKEHGVAILVGEKTFGKGSVQELVPISSDGAALKVTIAKWLTPLGKSISEEGLTPDFDIKRTDEDLKAGRDPQLDKAIEILKNL